MLVTNTTVGSIQPMSEKNDAVTAAPSAISFTSCPFILTLPCSKRFVDPAVWISCGFQTGQLLFHPFHPRTK